MTLRAALVALAVTALPPATPIAAQEEPPMPELPQRFRLGISASAWSWEGSPDGTPDVGNSGAVGLEIESLLTSWLSFRLGLSYANPTHRTIDDAVDSNQYLAEIVAALRAPWDALRPWGVTPFVTGGWGSLVHDPERDELVTKTQSTRLYGAGAEWDGLDRFGIRVEWRRTEAELNDIFDPEERDSRTVDANRVLWVFFWRF